MQVSAQEALEDVLVRGPSRIDVGDQVIPQGL